LACEDARVGIFAIAGDFATRGGSNGGVDLLDLATGQSNNHLFPTFEDDAGTRTSLQLPAIPTSDGDVIGFVPELDLATMGIYRDHQGVVTKLGTAPGMPGSQLNPVTDGTNVVFDAYGVASQPVYDVELLRGGAPQTLGGPQPQIPLQPPQDYLVNNGWVAYATLANGVRQVSSLAPDGGITQLSVYNSDSVIEALARSGEVIFVNGGSRYRRQPPALPEAIGSTLGMAVPGCDGWYVMMGGTLFQIAETADAGAGCAPMDAGTSAEGGVDGGSIDDGGTVDATIPRTDSGPSPGAEGGLPGDAGARQGDEAGGPAQAAPSTGGGGCALAANPRDSGTTPWECVGALVAAASWVRRRPTRQIPYR
jgi:hypothetical protein